MFARLLILLYAIASYAVFLVSFLYALGFAGNYLVPSYLVPKSIDVGGRTGLGEAIVVDLLLLGLFAIRPSITTARRAFKQWWAVIFPAAGQRSGRAMLLPRIFGRRRSDECQSVARSAIR
jgi:hypothetical protein